MPVWALPLCFLGFVMAAMAMRRLTFGMGLLGLHPEPHLNTKFAALVAKGEWGALEKFASSLDHPVAQVLFAAQQAADAGRLPVVDEEWQNEQIERHMRPVTRAGAVGTFGGLFAAAGSLAVGRSGSVLGWVGTGIALALVVLVARRHHQVARGLERVLPLCDVVFDTKRDSRPAK